MRLEEILHFGISIYSVYKMEKGNIKVTANFWIQVFFFFSFFGKKGIQAFLNGQACEFNSSSF